MIESMNITWLGESACSRVELCGGKAANLSLLAEMYPVPSGFCVTTQACSAAMSQKLNFDHKISIKDALPVTLLSEISNAYLRLEKQCRGDVLKVAVRSSAADEDGAQASFAGQHDTYLNVIGIDAVCDAIVKCFASAFTEQAIAYRRAHKQKADEVHIAVLIQEMVPADVSFVMFSVNPLSQIPEETMINASWGLGECVVSGEVTPDVFVIDKDEGNMISENISLKNQMTIQSNQGTKQVSVPRFLQQRSCLDAGQIKQIVDLGKALEQQMGWPVDVEGAFYQEQLYLLQCRPITTLDQKE